MQLFDYGFRIGHNMLNIFQRNDKFFLRVNNQDFHQLYQPKSSISLTNDLDAGYTSHVSSIDYQDKKNPFEIKKN